MRGYDAWLEKPYQDAARRDEDFEMWAAAHKPDLDGEDKAAVDAAWAEFVQWEADQETEYYERRAEELREEGRL